MKTLLFIVAVLLLLAAVYGVLRWTIYLGADA